MDDYLSILKYAAFASDMGICPFHSNDNFVNFHLILISSFEGTFYFFLPDHKKSCSSAASSNMR